MLLTNNGKSDIEIGSRIGIAENDFKRLNKWSVRMARTQNLQRIGSCEGLWSVEKTEDITRFW